MLTAVGFSVEWIRPRAVLTEETVTRALQQDPSQLEALVTTELALEAQRQGESVGRRLVASARRVAATLRGSGPRRRYLILGHSHRPEACEWADERHSVVYLNAGSWLPQADGPADAVTPCFVWLARRGDAYVRHRLLKLDAVAH